MRVRIVKLAALVLFSAAIIITAQSPTATDRLSEAEKAKRTKGLEAAIAIYESVPRDFPADRSSGAKALVEIVKAYDNLEEKVKAAQACERLLDGYQNQPEVPADVRARCVPSPRTVAGIFMAQVDPQTGAIRQPVRSLTADPKLWEVYPTFSPDGKSIAFRRFATPDCCVNGTLVVRSLESMTEQTNRVIACGSGDGLSASPSRWLDSKGLLTVLTSNPRGNSCVLRNDVSNGLAPVPILQAGSDLIGGYAALSPDGRTLYADQAPGPAPLAGRSVPLTITVAFDLATQEIRRAYPLPVLQGRNTVNSLAPPIISVSPDGRTIAHVRWALSLDAHLVRYNVEGDLGYRVLLSSAGRIQSPVWTKDGREILFAGSPNSADTLRIMRMPADGGPAKFTGLEVTGLRNFDLSPDGTKIVFDGLSHRILPPEAPPQPLVPNPPAEPTPRGLRGGRGNAALPAIGQIAFYDREGKVVKRLPDVLPTTSLNLSPDGTHVAVLRNDNLLNIDIASGASKFVATNVANGLAWSPDSAQIVYRRSDNTGFIRVANGSEPEVFYQRMGNLWNWSGDGRFILLGTGGSLAALATATKTLVPVSGLPGGTVSRISPDGRFVAYISSAQEVLVRALDSTASASVKIGDGSFGMIRWRSDGKELYYLTAAAVMAVPVTAVTPEFKTGAATRLFAAPAGFQLQSGGSPLADASADGQRFVFLVPAQ